MARNGEGSWHESGLDQKLEVAHPKALYLYMIRELGYDKNAMSFPEFRIYNFGGGGSKLHSNALW